MKRAKNFKKLGSIVLGLFGVAALFTSCAKERTCACTQTTTWSYTYAGSTTSGSSTYLFNVTSKGKCEDVVINDPDGNQSSGGYTTTTVYSCK
ncbi:MAG: hypothetical protein IH948_04255 [Bacteroidetes bacterium]|nr:hypothetical protein [Bacteroidota bacterium]